MTIVDDAISLNLSLPRDIYDRVIQTALDEQRQLDDLLISLISKGLDSHLTVRELLEHTSQQYRSRLAREGKLQDSPEQVLQELRDLREQIAHELYPS